MSRLTSVTPPGQSAVTYTWDDNGNLTDRGDDEFVWDYEDRLVEATVDSTTTTFAYRGDGLRDSRTVGMSTTTFTWDVNAGLPVVIEDTDARYVYGGGLVSQERSGQMYYYLADGLGSTMAIVDSGGDVQDSYTYDVYGQPTVTGSLANEHDFAGQATDPSTGLQYLRARYMDPETGVFLSRDPLAAAPAFTRHAYLYAEASPCNVTDPAGLKGQKGCDDFWLDITNALFSLSRAIINCRNGGYGHYWRDGTPMDEVDRKGHYENYANHQRQLGRAMVDWEDNQCKFDRKDFFDQVRKWKAAEYFVTTPLDKAAREWGKGNKNQIQKIWSGVTSGWEALVDVLDEVEKELKETDFGGIPIPVPGGVPPVPVLP